MYVLPQTTNLRIECAEPWRETTPNPKAPGLITEEDGRLRLLSRNLELRHDFGAIGPVDCPIAYDPVRRLAFRYVCATGDRRGDYSQLRAFAVDRGESYALKEMPLNQWALWLLEWIQSKDQEPGQLFGLLAMDRPAKAQVLIEHRLFAYRLGDAQLRLRLLCRDAYKPLAFSRARRELVFAGAEGIYLLNLRGERRLTLPTDVSSGGQGGAFDPSGAPRVVIGGDGLHLWDLQHNRCRRLTRSGRHPVWARDSGGIWYRESSADLHYYDFDEDATKRVVSLGRQRHPDFWYARPVSLSHCGRYMALSLTEKALRGVSRKESVTGVAPERVYVHKHLLCVLDLREKAYWSRPGFANHLQWVAPQGGEGSICLPYS